MKTIWDKYAKVLVDYSTNVQKGDLVQIRGASVYTKELVKAVYKRVLERGGHPMNSLILSIRLRNLNMKQLINSFQSAAL